MYKFNVKINKSTPKQVLRGLDLEHIQSESIAPAAELAPSKHALRAPKPGIAPSLSLTDSDQSVVTATKLGSFTIPSAEKKTVGQLKDLLKHKYRLADTATIDILVDGASLEDSAQVTGKVISCTIDESDPKYARKSHVHATTTSTTIAPVVETTTVAPVVETTTVPVVETTTSAPTVETTTVAP